MKQIKDLSKIELGKTYWIFCFDYIGPGKATKIKKYTNCFKATFDIPIIEEEKQKYYTIDDFDLSYDAEVMEVF